MQKWSTISGRQKGWVWEDNRLFGAQQQKDVSFSIVYLSLILFALLHDKQFATLPTRFMHTAYVCVLSNIFSHSVGKKMDTFGSFLYFFSHSPSIDETHNSHKLTAHWFAMLFIVVCTLCICLYALNFIASTHFCQTFLTPFLWLA